MSKKAINLDKLAKKKHIPHVGDTVIDETFNTKGYITEVKKNFLDGTVNITVGFLHRPEDAVVEREKQKLLDQAKLD